LAAGQCFNRVIFRGYSPFSYGRSVAQFLDGHGIRREGLKVFAPE
jgi:hypothetical protein